MKIHILKNTIKITIMIIIVLINNVKNASAAPDIGVDFQWHHIDDNPLTNIQTTYSNDPANPWFFTKFAANTSPCTAAEHPPESGMSSFGTKYRWNQNPKPVPHHWYPYNFTTQIINSSGVVVAQKENIDCGRGHVPNDSPGTGFPGNYVGNYTIRTITPPPNATWVQNNVNNHPSPPAGLRCFLGWRESWNGTRKENSTVTTYNTCSFTDNLPATIDGIGIITHIIHIYFRGKPARPENISTTTVTNPAWNEGAGIRLQWDDITPNETRYLVIVRDTATNTTLHTYSIGTGPGTDSVYNRQTMTHDIQFPGLCNGTNRTIYIRSENSWGHEGDVATAPVSCTIATPQTPANFQSLNNAPNNNVRLTWQDTNNEDYYLLRIFNLDGNNITSPPTGIVIPKNTTFYFDTGICGTSPRRYELYAVNSSGSSSPAITRGACSLAADQNNSGRLIVENPTPSGTLTTTTRPELRFRGTATPDRVGNIDGRAKLEYTITINSPSDPPVYSSIELHDSMIVNTTYNTYDFTIPWPVYRQRANDPVQNAKTITVTVSLQSPNGERNLDTPRTFTYTWTNHDTQAAVIPERQPLESLPEPNKSRKEISATPPRQISGGGTGFTDIDSTRNFLISGLEYWVRLSIDGKKTTTITQTIQNDIMLILDVTGSMTSEMLINNSTTEKISRIEAAKIALKQFVTDTDPNDYLGLGSYAICEPTNQKYDTSQIPIVWAYEGLNRECGAHVGYGYVHIVPQLAAITKQQINELLQSGNPLNFYWDSSKRQSNINFCKNNYHTGAATNIGGGIVTGLSMLTNLIQDQKRPDNTSYRNSMAGPFPSPSYRQSTNKYIVLATDGEENIEPKAYSQQHILGDQTINAVQYAKANNIKIYTLTIGHASGRQVNLMSKIARDTGGEYYAGANLEQLTNSYKNILREIQSISAPTGIRVEERINNNHFDIINLDETSYTNNFVITKATWNQLQNRYEEKNMTDEICQTYKQCITNYSASGVDVQLPQFEEDERYYIYFKVRAKNPGIDIEVNDNKSKIAFQDNTSRPLANKRVTIIEPEPFFTAAGNSVYSNANISSMLIFSDEKFITDDKGISKAKGTQTFTNGQVSESGYQLNNYENKEKTSYINIREKFKDKIQTINITNTEFKISDLPTSSSESKEIYIQLNNTNTINRKYKFIPPSSPLNDKIRRTIFIPGDLYITNNFETDPDGMTNVLFIVEGNVGFNGTVTKFDGIIIADGTIDTNCDTTTKEFRQTGNKNTCEPDTLQNSQITLSGMFYANKGFQLDRKGNPSVINRQAGERFIFRPDFYMSASKILGSPEIIWKEISN